MSETYTEASIDQDYQAVVDSQTPEPEADGELNEIQDFVQPLVNLVNSNGNEVREWLWMGGVEGPLSTSIWRHPLAQKNLQPHEVPIVMADIYTGLNSKKPETEEENESSETDKDEETEKALDHKTGNKPQSNKKVARTQEEQLDQKSLPNKSAPKIIAHTPVISRVEEPAEPKSQDRATAGENAQATTKPIKPGAEPSQGEPADKLAPKVAQEQPMLDVPEKAVGDITASGIKSEMDQTQPEQPEIIKKTPASESVEITLNLGAELSQEEGFEDSPDTVDDPELIYSREDFEDDPSAQFEFDETELIVSEPLEVGVAGTYLETIEENQNPEQSDFADLTIEEIERPLVQLAEAIETSSPEVIGEINQILDKIIEVPQKTEIDGGVNTAGEAEAQKKLEELFIKLFDRMNIEYTDEQIEALAYLTIHWGLVDELAELKAKKKLEDEPKDRGTHEIIRKILVAMSTIKKALLNAGSIGKSALRLYNISNAKYLTSQVF